MSKSLGNVIDPLDIIRGIRLDELHAKLETGNLKKKEIGRAKAYQNKEFPSGIPACGADALRFNLLSKTSSPDDINLDIPGLVTHQRFCNKIWQASKYIMRHLPDSFQPVAHLDVDRLSEPERWILHRMNCAVQEVNEALETRHFSAAAEAAHRYFRDELCDVFIEHSKHLLGTEDEDRVYGVRQTLYRALDVGLRLLHPFIPFITEELWQRLPRVSYGSAASTPPSIMLAPYPTFDTSLEFPEEAESYSFCLQCAHAIRSLAIEYVIKWDGRAFIKLTNETTLSNTMNKIESITALCRRYISTLEFVGPDDPLPTGCAVYALSSDVLAFLHVADNITDVAEAIKNLEAKIESKQQIVERQTEIINQEGFDERPRSVQDAEIEKLEKVKISIANSYRTIAEFAKIEPPSEKDKEVEEEKKEVTD